MNMSDAFNQPPIFYKNENPFEVGDKVRCVKSQSHELPQVGEEFIITFIRNWFIGFQPLYPEYYFYFEEFKLLEKAEDIPFNDQMKDILR